MVQQSTTTVKLDAYHGLSIGQGHSCVGMELADAIQMAKKVLAFAEGRLVEIAGDSLSVEEYEALNEALGDPATLATLDKMELAQEARWDATTSHWGHD